MPLSGMIGDPGPDLDEPFDQPLDRAPHSLALDVEPAEHVKQVVSQSSHLEAGLIGSEAVAAGLVPAKGVLPLLDSVLNISSAIVDLHHLDLMPTPGRAPHRACHMRRYFLIELRVGAKPDEIGDPLLLAVLVDVRAGEGGVPAKPEKPEPGTVPPHDGVEKNEGSIHRVHVARTKIRAQAGAFACEGKQGMKTVRPEVAVVGGPLLAAVGRVLSGVNVDDQPTPVLLPQEGIDRAPKSAVQGLELGLVAKEPRSPAETAWTGLLPSCDLC